MKYTKDNISKALSFYKEVLGLQSWVIDLKVVRRYDMPDESAMGYAQLATNHKAAIITLLDPIDYNPNHGERFTCIETVLAHELCHVVLHDLSCYAVDANCPEFIMERAVEDMAVALVALRKKKDSK